MKKAFLLVLLLCCAWSHAQRSFKPGIRAGINLSHFTEGHYGWFEDEGTPLENDRNYSSKTAFYLGVTGAIKLTRFYTLQPELNYSRQGTVFGIEGSGLKETLNISYLSPTVNNKFTFGEQFNVQVGAAIDFQVEADFKTDSDVDFALFLGAGYQFSKKFGVEVRAKKGFIPVLDYSDGNHTNVVFSLGATYSFDLK